MALMVSWQYWDLGMEMPNQNLNCERPIVMAAPDVPLNALDAVAFALTSLCILGEAVADEQMWQYQTEKYRRRAAGEAPGPYARGFIESGLWSLCRHPNYFCEMSTWWSLYLFSVAAGTPGALGGWVNWTIAGPLFLTVLFVPPRASIDVTETLASSKYPAYKEYQAAVSRIVPWFPGKAKKAAAGNGKAVKKVGNTPPPKPTRSPRLKQTRPSRSPARR